MSYLKQRTEQLQTKDRLVTVMIDEVYTAKQIEYSNSTFVGLNNGENLVKLALHLWSSLPAPNSKTLCALYLYENWT